jgi:hypothetical protein
MTSSVKSWISLALVSLSLVSGPAAAGDSVFSMTTKGGLWAWSLASGPAGGTDPSRNYMIRHSDCDGAFDEL